MSMGAGGGSGASGGAATFGKLNTLHEFGGSNGRDGYTPGSGWVQQPANPVAVAQQTPEQQAQAAALKAAGRSATGTTGPNTPNPSMLSAVGSATSLGSGAGKSLLG